MNGIGEGRNRFGSPLASRLGSLLLPRTVAERVRLRCRALAEVVAGKTRGQPSVAPVAAPGEPALLAAEVAALGAEHLLCEQNEFAVYIAEAQRIPHLLQEIGRLREVTFRACGEGTGRCRDVDLYDSYYLHLFIWNRARNELVGAYRLGEVDRIVARYGHRRLYTYSLFRYRRRLLDKLGPAIELGRSFIRLEYQRQYAPLLLLWKGIGAFVAGNPRYRVLFGPVSISADYGDASRQLLVDYLTQHKSVPALVGQVQPRRPFRQVTSALVVPAEVEQVSRLVEQLERDGKGMPILLRQYLKMGGKVLGFNVDAAFADVLDGLIMVDLAQTDPKVLARYIGREATDAYLERQRALLLAS